MLRNSENENVNPDLSSKDTLVAPLLRCCPTHTWAHNEPFGQPVLQPLPSSWSNKALSVSIRLLVFLLHMSITSHYLLEEQSKLRT